MSEKNGAGYDTSIEDVGGEIVETVEEQQVTVPLTENELEEIMYGESLSFLFKVISTGETIELVIRKGTDNDYPPTHSEATE